LTSESARTAGFRLRRRRLSLRSPGRHTGSPRTLRDRCNAVKHFGRRTQAGEKSIGAEQRHDVRRRLALRRRLLPAAAIWRMPTWFRVICRPACWPSFSDLPYYVKGGRLHAASAASRLAPARPSRSGVDNITYLRQRVTSEGVRRGYVALTNPVRPSVHRFCLYFRRWRCRRLRLIGSDPTYGQS
jgi:hypothetical protein